MAEEQKRGKSLSEGLLQWGRINLLVSAVLLAAILALPVLIERIGERTADAPLNALITGNMAGLSRDRAGEMVPGVVFQNRAGRDLTFEAFRGQVMLINFWATWCAPCVAEMPSIAELDQRLGGEDFAVVAISLDREGPSLAGPFLDKVKAGSLDLYTETNLLMLPAFGENGLPVSVLVDRAGREIARLRGPADWASPEAEALIKYLIDPTGDGES